MENALHAASNGGHEAIEKMLINNGALTNTKPWSIQSVH